MIISQHVLSLSRWGYFSRTLWTYFESLQTFNAPFLSLPACVKQINITQNQGRFLRSITYKQKNRELVTTVILLIHKILLLLKSLTRYLLDLVTKIKKYSNPSQHRTITRAEHIKWQNLPLWLENSVIFNAGACLLQWGHALCRSSLFLKTLFQEYKA